MNECGFIWIYEKGLTFACYRVPEAQLPLAHPGEPCGEDVSFSGEHGPHRPDALMWSQTFLLAGRRTRLRTEDELRFVYNFYLGVTRSLSLMHPVFTHRHHLPLAGVADTQTSILTGGAKQAAVAVPADAVNEVWVVVHGDERFSCSHVPDDDQVIAAWKRKC